MTINTKRLVIRPITADDLHSVFKWQSCAESRKYINTPLTDISQSEENLKHSVEQWEGNHQSYYGFGILLGDEMIGEVAITYGCGGCGSCAPGEAVIGYIFDKDFWGNDYESEVTEAMIEYCFSTLGAEKIFMCHAHEDTETARVINSFGFQFHSEQKNEQTDGKVYLENGYFLHNPTL